MSEHGKKMIAPICITALLLIYFILYFTCILVIINDLVVLILLGIIPLGIAGGLIYMCIQRLREIEEGEEDDLSKY